MTGDDWSHPEIVRNLRALTQAVHDVGTELRGLSATFLPRNEARLRDAHVDSRLTDLGTRVLDVEADLTRHRREHSDRTDRTWATWVVPVVTGVLVAVVAALVAVVAGR